MTRSISFVAAFVLVSAVPSVLQAQDGAVGPARSAAEVGSEGLKFGAAPPNLPFGTALYSNPLAQNTSTVQFFLDSSTKDRVGTIAIGWKHGNGNFRLALSGPLDANDDTEPLALSGLGRGASARLSLNRYGWRPPNLSEQREAEALCARLKLSGSDCSVRKLEASFPEDSSRLAKLEHLHDKPWLFGGEASVTQRGFRFLQPETFASGSQDELGFSASARLGIYSPSLGFLFASYSYERDFEAAGRPSDICRPVGATSALRCQMAVIGGPVEANQSIVGIELRRLFTRQANAGVAPSLRYDFDAKSWLVEVPLYLVPGSGKISGGVRFGWRSDTKDVTAVVFVGTIFELFGS